MQETDRVHKNVHSKSQYHRLDFEVHFRCIIHISISVVKQGDIETVLKALKFDLSCRCFTTLKADENSLYNLTVLHFCRYICLYF